MAWAVAQRNWSALAVAPMWGPAPIGRRALQHGQRWMAVLVGPQRDDPCGRGCRPLAGAPVRLGNHDGLGPEHGVMRHADCGECALARGQAKAAEGVARQGVTGPERQANLVSPARRALPEAGGLLARIIHQG
jgi:hypothetical protein